MKIVKTVPPKSIPESDFVVVFWGLEPTAFQGGPKDPPEHPTISNLVEICKKNGACHVLLRLVPD